MAVKIHQFHGLGLCGGLWGSMQLKMMVKFPAPLTCIIV